MKINRLLKKRDNNSIVINNLNLTPKNNIGSIK